MEQVEENIKYKLSKKDLEKAQTLIEVFKKKNITVKHTFYKLLGFVERESFNGFFDNATAFFGHLPENVKNTGMLTGMLHNVRKYIRSFAERSQGELEYLASLDVLTSLSSMNNSKGIPRQEEVEEVLGWPEWKDQNGEFDRERFQSFSSMYNTKGLPEHKDVKEVLGWSEWKDKDGQFNIKLFRCFSSMNHGKGKLKYGKVKEILGWPEWKDRDGEFNMELFRAFSSMNGGKGVPKHEEHKKLKAMLDWPEWRDKNGEFNMELFRSFSSMFAKRGMPKHKEVKVVLGWQVWKDKDGEFSMELLRTISSMNHARGLPEREEEVKEVLGWQVWKDKYGEFSMERFRIFSSMIHATGLPEHEEEVKEVLNWPEWKDKYGEFSMERLRAFCSMNFSRGMPRYEQVKKVLGWPEWKDQDGEFSKERFHAFSSINYGQGVPKHGPVKKLMNWISCGGVPNHLLLQIMARLWASEGLPAIEELKHQETQLKQWLLTASSEENSGLDNDLDNEENDQFNRQLKTVSLYLSTPKPDWLINWAVLKQFHHLEKTKPALMLESLITLLSSYGGKGVKNYLKANQRNRDFLWRHSGKTAPLHLLKGDEMALMHTVTVLKKAKIDIADHILEGWRQQACSKIEQLKKRNPLLSDVAPDVYQICQELELLDEH
ncbi:hypothetical protein [Endozoicomonas sp. 8E]|uniref:hypothetical protein n=1 Tax=Endozoicomonas sp. 8E TaxID=3035692 RepID=UPI0029392CD4|nr:hypothetical protein [Endozoicomonas sp. 8E]WOG29530.1 hypothetical protein P6910_07735 [Endozoicomonas sp. 8E]